MSISLDTFSMRVYYIIQHKFGEHIKNSKKKFMTIRFLMGLNKG